MNQILTPISIGELYDKISILKRKSRELEKISPTKAKNVDKEYEELCLCAMEVEANLDDGQNSVLKVLFEDLTKINNTLWEVEDEIRRLDPEVFIPSPSIQSLKKYLILARAVYNLNDERSQVKKEINTLTGSSIIEEKAYG